MNQELFKGTMMDFPLKHETDFSGSLSALKISDVCHVCMGLTTCTHMGHQWCPLWYVHSLTTHRPAHSLYPLG